MWSSRMKILAGWSVWCRSDELGSPGRCRETRRVLCDSVSGSRRERDAGGPVLGHGERWARIATAEYSGSCTQLSALHHLTSSWNCLKLP